ncbi:hypothetical protein DRJ16_04430 [Candidatus Woesearchaeota archaeon]|nr:MAG: hypothetical protein DRJ16_04430 [Candidatus Woesearchaeota archaeon]
MKKKKTRAKTKEMRWFILIGVVGLLVMLILVSLSFSQEEKSKNEGEKKPPIDLEADYGFTKKDLEDSIKYTLGEHSFIYRDGEWYYNGKKCSLIYLDTEPYPLFELPDESRVEVRKGMKVIVTYKDKTQEEYIYKKMNGKRVLESKITYDKNGVFVDGEEHFIVGTDFSKEYGNAFYWEWEYNKKTKKKEGYIYSEKDGSVVGYGVGDECYIVSPDSYKVLRIKDKEEVIGKYEYKEGTWRDAQGNEVKDENILNVLKDVHRERYYYRWLTGEVSLGEILEAAGEIIPAAEKALMPGLSSWIAKQWRNFKEWREAIDKGFAKACLGEEYWKSEICDAHLERLNKQTLVIESPAGEVQFVAHVEAERSSPMPKECPCKADEECIGGICYKDGQPLVKYFYKITYGVRAPSDIGLTPEIDEKGAISFTLKLEGEVSKYVYVIEGTQKPYYFHLKPGKEKSAVGDEALLFFSTRKYDKICILFGKKPVGKQGKISFLCNKIAESQRSYENWREAALAGVAPEEAPTLVPEFNPDI